MARREPSPTPPIRTLRFDEPVAVIGDVHGRSDLLREMLARLPDRIPILVVGDVCDRGPDTFGVIELLIRRNAYGVCGNHDEWLIRWATRGGFDSSARSKSMGGDSTLASYGVVGRSTTDVESEAWRVPRAHRDWLESLSVAIDLEVQGQQYWVLHAGVPDRTFRELSPEDIVPWLAVNRPGDLRWTATAAAQMPDVGRPVIFGHLPVVEPLDNGTAIAIDTGCGTSVGGGLTAVILPERTFVTVRPTVL